MTSSGVAAGCLVISSLGISMEPGESQASTLSLTQIKVLHRVHDVLFWVSPLLAAAMTEKEGVRVIRPVRSERSVPGYKTGRSGRTGRDRQGRPQGWPTLILLILKWH